MRWLWHLFGMAKEHHDDRLAEAICQLSCAITEWREQTERDNKTILHRIEHKLDTIMTALETLTESVNANTAGQAELTIAVNAAVVQLGTPGATDAQLLTLAAAVDSSTASDAALTKALNDAVTPPVVEPPVA